MKPRMTSQPAPRSHPFRRSRLAVSIHGLLAASALLWTPLQVAQVLQDAPPLLSIESALGSVLFARSVSNELELRRLSLQLLEATELLPASDAKAATGLKLPPAGTAAGTGSPFPVNADFFRLPGSLSTRTDANGNLLAYCAFDLRGTASAGRAAGRLESDGSVSGNSVSLVIISPGNNGRYEFRCSDLKNIQPGQLKTPSFPITIGGRDYDDLVYVLTHNEVSNAGTQRQNLGASVQTYDNLTQLTSSLSGGSAALNQIRWVRSLNQFFIADSVNANGTGFNWKPLTPSLALSDIAENRASFSWLSGATAMGRIGAGTRPAGGIDLIEKPGALTLGTRTLQKDGATLNPDALAAGVVLHDINNQFRTYVGLSDTNQTSFVIRHLATNASVAVDRLRIAADGQVFITGPIKLSGLLTADAATFGGPLNANAGIVTTTGRFSGGISATTGNFSGGISATTGRFSGLLSAEGGFETTRGSFSDGISATTGGFTGLLTAGAGLESTTGRFSGLLTANGGILASGGTFSGTLSANGGLSASSGIFTELLNANGGLTGTSASFSGLLTATGGLTSSTGTFSDLLTASGGIIGTTGTFSGLLTANGGLSATTGSFSGLLSANGGLSATSGNFSGDVDIAGSLRVRSNLRVDGDASIGGNLTVAGRILGLNVVNLRFFGYRAQNSDPVQIGAGQFDLNTSSYDFYLNQANESLYSINQNLNSTGSPTFTGLVLNSGGLSSSGNISTSGQFIGYLNGTARIADQVNKTLTLYFRKNDGDAPYARADFDLRNNGNQEQIITVNSTPVINNGNFYSDNAFNNTDNRSVTAVIQNPNITYNVTCTINGSSAPDCSAANANFTVTAQAEQNSFLQGNTYSNQGSNNPVSLTENLTQNTVNLTQSGTGTVSYAPEAGVFRSPITLKVNGDFISDASVSLNGGQTTTLTLSSTGLGFAKNMNQDVKTDSTVRFNQLRVDSTGTLRHVQTETLEASNSASVRSLLMVLTGSGSNSIRFDGNNSSAAIGAVTINGIDNSVTATRFIGTADRAVRLSQDLSFIFTGVISGSTSTSNGFSYTINTTLADNSISSSKLLNVDGAKLIDGTVSTAKLLDSSVTTQKLADAAVTHNKLADEAVSTSKLANAAVTTAKLANAAVTSDKIAAGAVNTEKLAAGATIDFARNLVSSSDMRLKNSIVRVDGASLLQRLSQTLLYGFSFNREPERGRQLGVLAQELAPLFPELVSVQTEGPDAGFLGVNYGVLGAVSAAGVGELNRKLDALGIRLRNATTVEATLPVFAVTRIEGTQARFDRIEADEINAKTARFEKLDAQQFVTDRSRTRQLQADTVNSGSAEGFGMGSGLLLFTASGDGHYLVQVSASDGSHASATVFVSAGSVYVVPVGGTDISITAAAGAVYAIGPGKHMKASWLKTG